MLLTASTIKPRQVVTPQISWSRQRIATHKPRAAWVFERLLLHRRSAASWAGCVMYSALVSFF